MNEEQYLIAIIAAILLSGRGCADLTKSSKHRQRLAMLEAEKKLAISEARDLIKLAKDPQS